jgi:hypothetical protein
MPWLEPGPWVGDDDHWLMIGAGFELSNFVRSRELGKVFRWRTSGIVNDRQLEERYRAAGIEHLFFVFALVDPDVEPPRTRFTRRGPKAFAQASFPDDPLVSAGEFDAWLEPRVRAALQGYGRLPAE